MADHSPKINKYGINAIGKHIGQAIMTALLLFLGAGSTAWNWGWVFVLVYIGCWIVLSIVVAIRNPALLNQRGLPIKQATVGTKTWDIVLLAIYAVLILVQPFVAGLDWRNNWSAPISPLVYSFGNFLMMFGFFWLGWSMIANLFFEPSVRIQESEGQRVATGGPYRFVRHPGYIGIILQFLALPVALGCWVALIPGAVGIVVFVIRTALEDRALHDELPGYSDYAQQTRYRLLPAVW